jgi:hypothetical protein
MFGSRKTRGGPSQEPPSIQPGAASAGDAAEPAAADGGPLATAVGAERTLERGRRKLNLVGSQQLTRAVVEAVRQGLQEQFELDDQQLQAAVRGIGVRLFEQLRAGSKAVRGVPKDAFLQEVEADRRRIEAAREAARKELDELLDRLQGSREEHERRRLELERRSREEGEVEDEQLARRIEAAFAASGDSADLAALREKITALALGSVQGQRDQTLEAQLVDQRAQIAQFERRIAKLTSSLEMTEEELKRVAAEKNIDLGVSSRFRSVQGLSSSDEKYETKKELMSCIFQANLELQKGKGKSGES